MTTMKRGTKKLQTYRQVSKVTHQEFRHQAPKVRPPKSEGMQVHYIDAPKKENKP